MTRMQFPDSLPAPRLQDYSRKLMTAQGRQKFLNQTRSFRRTRSSPVVDTVTFRCDASQKETLRDFYRGSRSQYFEIRLPGDGGLVTEQASFWAPLTYTPLGNQRWDISTELIIPLPSLIPVNELDMKFLDYMQVSDGSFDDPLNSFVQTEWPTL